MAKFMEIRKQERIKSLVEERKTIKKSFIENASTTELQSFVQDPQSSLQSIKNLDRSMLNDDYAFEASNIAAKIDLNTNFKVKGDIGTKSIPGVLNFGE